MMTKKVHLVILSSHKEDDELLRRLLAQIPETHYDVQSISEPEQFLNVLKAQAADVYILDEHLQNQSGLQLLRDIQPLALSKPILVMTNEVDRAIDLQAMEYGASDYFAKSQVSAESLDRSIRYALRRGETKTKFLAYMSHEIRTPLSAILGFLELAADASISDKDRQEFMRTIKQTSEHLMNIINDVLDLSKIEAGRATLATQEVAWRDVIKDVVQILKPKAQEKGLEIRCNVDNDIPDIVKSDAQRLRQILMNLVSNAIKFTAHGSINIVCDSHFDTNNPAGNLVISVHDTGIGIKPEEQKNLFQPFGQANQESQTKYGGTGLGLELSRKLARALGGDLNLTSSTPNGGSVFTLTLPGVFPHPQVRQSANALKRADLSGVDFDGMKVLLAEDAKATQIILKALLSKVNCEVDVASDGREAVNKAKAKNYDIILMDIEMPDMGGYEATRILRQSGYTAPIVAVTGHTLTEERNRILNSGFSGYLSKPVEKDTLFQTLSQFALARLAFTKPTASRKDDRKTMVVEPGPF